MMKKLVVLVSNVGTGTNLQAIIDAIENGKIQASIVLVISDTVNSPAVKRARKHTLPIAICSAKEELLPLLEKYEPDYICLAGWKQFIPKAVIEKNKNKILNLHPGTIPDTKDGVVKNPDGSDALWNKGMLTDKAINNVLENNATYAASSIHFLSEEFDFGSVLGRCFEKVEKGDTVETLYKRLKVKENQLYVDVLMKLCNR